MRKNAATGICVVVLLAMIVTGCGFAAASTAAPGTFITAAPTAAPATVITAASTSAPGTIATASPTVQPERFPETMEIDVTREGETETLTARRYYSSQGYVMYVFPQFTVTPLPDGDLITLAGAPDDSLRSVMMQITVADDFVAQDTDTELRDELKTVRRSRSFALAGKRYTVMWQYPLSAAEGIPVLFMAMLDSMGYYLDEDYAYAPPGEGINDYSWPEFRPVAYDRVLLINGVDIKANAADAALGFFQKPTGVDVYDAGYQFGMIKTYRTATYTFAKDAKIYFQRYLEEPILLDGLGALERKVKDGFIAWLAIYKDGVITALHNEPWRQTYAYYVEGMDMTPGGQTRISVTPGLFVEYPALEDNYSFIAQDGAPVLKYPIASDAAVTVNWLYDSPENETAVSLSEFNGVYCYLTLEDNVVTGIRGIYVP